MRTLELAGIEIAAFIGRRRLSRKHKLHAAREAAFYLDTCAGVVASGKDGVL